MSGSLTSEALREHLVSRRSQVATFLQTPQEDTAHDEESAENPGRRLVREYGVAIAKAELAWLDTQLAQLR
jgi:hypothetical protein